MKDTIIVLAGNGGTAFGKKDIINAVSGYMNQYRNVITIGNGTDDISITKIKDSLAQHSGDNFDVCIYAHGEKRQNGFNFYFGGDNYVHCIKLFDEINKTTDKPVNLHIFSCHGGVRSQSLI